MATSLLPRFERFANDVRATELDAALLVNALLDESLDGARLAREVAALAAAGDLRMPAWEHLRREGFRGDRDDYAALDNSRLDRVLARRRGIPITLGVLLIEAARARGNRAAGINFPGHFLVRVEDALIDPFDLCVTSEAEWIERLPEAMRGQGAFAAASPAAVLTRMLNNVKQRHLEDQRWHLALDVLDCQAAMLTGSAEIAFERGEIWQRLGAVDAARSAFETARACAGDAQPTIARAARARLEALAHVRETKH